ncbi:putative efflux pump antibiotic resistance [Rosellinia necatrix]|uniref:Putative efflux pump antibiotic resistance n=1 Tax=Rosellinia necatrix TaxID=77044 RepID=A0A1W2TLT0_ROSNE|nr:putative efflux pump antibiotic resistance [Rosellinia necatrix]
MFQNVQLRHAPALLVATTMTFGGLWPFLDARGAMEEFGFPARVAAAPAAAPVFRVGNARTTTIGLLVFLFYARGQLAAVDAVVAVTGAYCGLVDSYVVWREGNPRHALFRLASSGLLSACGLWGLTAGS